MKRPDLDPAWKTILKQAWSVRFMAMAMVFLACEAVVPLLVDSLPKNLFVGLTFVSIVCGGIARIILQKSK